MLCIDAVCGVVQDAKDGEALGLDLATGGSYASCSSCADDQRSDFMRVSRHDVADEEGYLALAPFSRDIVRGEVGEVDELGWPKHEQAFD